MREVYFIEIKIEPSYTARSGGELRELRVDVKYRGKEYHHIEPFYPPDSISALDYCFFRARRHIFNMIKKDENEHPDLAGE